MFDITARVDFVGVHDDFQAVIAGNQKTCHAEPLNLHRAILIAGFMLLF